MTIFQFNRKYCLILYTIYGFDDFDLIYVYVQVFFLIMKTFDVTWFAAIVLLHTGPVLSQLFNPQNSGQGLSPNGRLDISQFILPGNKIYPSVSLNIYNHKMSYWLWLLPQDTIIWGFLNIVHTPFFTCLLFTPFYTCPLPHSSFVLYLT